MIGGKEGLIEMLCRVLNRDGTGEAFAKLPFNDSMSIPVVLPPSTVLMVVSGWKIPITSKGIISGSMYVMLLALLLNK